MKIVSQSMPPLEAAQAFYGQDDTSIAQMIAKLGESDPRLVKAFKQTRKNCLEGVKS
ncbi:MAG: putative dinucleotide-binding enzyme [Yoonia sp.]|jgi:predicted dinucleotide-binding enzyme